jgi:hypothetical protein
MRKTLTLVAAALVGLFAAGPGRAQEAAAVNHVLKTTLLDGGTVKLGGLPKAGLFFVGTPVSFRCTAACTLEVGIMEQVGGNRTPKNFWDICPLVDKKTTNAAPCLFQGALPIDSSFVVGNYLASVPLHAGAHTAQALVGVSAKATITFFQIAYRVYQP